MKWNQTRNTGTTRAKKSGTRNPQQPRNSESEKDNTLFCKIYPFWLFYSFEVFLSVLVHAQTAVWFPQAAQEKHTKSQPIFGTDLSS